MSRKRDREPQLVVTRCDALQGVGAIVGGAALGACSSDDENHPASPSATPEQLLANIDTFVIVMLENRTYDHYLGSLELSENRSVNGLRGGEANSTSDGRSVAVHALDNWTTLVDPPHGWDASHVQFNGGKTRSRRSSCLPRRSTPSPG